MPRSSPAALSLSRLEARRLWLRAQRLDTAAPFGAGPAATKSAIEHLGYVQIDTINVIERCHHHILWSRIPGYRRDHLRQAQTMDKSIFEYWTHALSYVPVRDLPFFLAGMKQHRQSPGTRFSAVTREELAKLIARIRIGGALSIRDIDDDTLQEKDHAWGSRKPSRRVLQFAFYMGTLTVSQRLGMLKTYELMDRHFGWEQRPKAASQTQINRYLLDRALRSQAVVSLDSICYQDAARKPLMRREIDTRVRRGLLQPVTVDGAAKVEHWLQPEALAEMAKLRPRSVHILSPFDPLIIQRKRLQLFFGYEHRFEAYVPKEKRVHGYFGLPVLVDDDIVAVIDLKTDRANKTMLLQQWTWIGAGKPALHKSRIEEQLHRFERFQLATPN
jgi:uncharacterized protein YcaQ